ncbi:HNH endonuclease [Aeromicrobium stalagmiti]|uniref:HNH endonuclease n=1 Tax=Aeromicrobium stalagmiti TaxID=2738988 RepID=UPI0015688355|nr:HNH endonuclease [Aeromicrobium stalagmiti]NRQ50396.1 HNH endonuclease [Aeromicrobium stalagmiti]
MKELLRTFRVVWDEDRHSSANAPSKGGGNLKREAYLDLYLAILEAVEPEPDLPTDSWLLRSIRARRGQAQFRQELLAAYGERCAVTASGARSVLEAAHIEPFAAGGKPHVSNGLLLRSDIHTLFDLGLLRIRPDLTVEIDNELDGTEYEELEGRGLRLPQDIEAQPSQAALAQRWNGATK